MPSGASARIPLNGGLHDCACRTGRLRGWSRHSQELPHGRRGDGDGGPTESPHRRHGCLRLQASPQLRPRPGPGRRVWAVEGTGSFGAGLTTDLLEQGEWVVEIDRPVRAARRNGAKSDELDATRAAREALTREHLAQPRRRGDREALRVLLTTRQGAQVSRTKAICHLKALVVNAPETLRNSLRSLATDELLERAARLRTAPTQSVEHRATIAALRSTARRVIAISAGRFRWGRGAACCRKNFSPAIPRFGGRGWLMIGT